jgi:hypothetical protein
MKIIYFGGSIRGGRDNVEIYNFMINYLKKFGKVLTEHVGDKNLNLEGEKGLLDKFIHDRDVGWLGEASHLVMEVSTPSLGVGYEIGRIAERNLWVPKEERKNILCLYRNNLDRKLSAMVNGSNGLKVSKYGDK